MPVNWNNTGLKFKGHVTGNFHHLRLDPIGMKGFGKMACWFKSCNHYFASSVVNRGEGNRETGQS